MQAILSGLDAKDRVVVNGLQRIHQAGEVVDPKEEQPAKEAGKKEKEVAAASVPPATIVAPVAAARTPVAAR